jgi:hypothetical protein
LVLPEDPFLLFIHLFFLPYAEYFLLSIFLLLYLFVLLLLLFFIYIIFLLLLLYAVYSSPPIYSFSSILSSPLCLFCCILYPTILIFSLIQLPLPTPTAAIFSLLATSISTSTTQPGLYFGIPLSISSPPLYHLLILSSALCRVFFFLLCPLQSIYYAFTLGSLRFSPFTLELPRNDA